MDMGQALDDLGVSRDLLQEDSIARLDRDGYAVIPGIMTPGMLTAFRASLAELEAVEGDRGGIEILQEAGAYRLSDLINKDPVFDVCFTHPKLLSAVAHVLPDFRLSSCASRTALPGHGQQPLHTDWRGTPFDKDSYQVCNSIWMLDDFTADNGATRVVPKTHQSGRFPYKEMKDPSQPHPDQTLLLGPAGTVVVFNGHLWHGGTENRTGLRRRSLTAFFTRRCNRQALNQAAYIRPQTLARLSPAARYILGVGVGATA